MRGAAAGQTSDVLHCYARAEGRDDVRVAVRRARRTSLQTSSRRTDHQSGQRVANSVALNESVHFAESLLGGLALRGWRGRLVGPRTSRWAWCSTLWRAKAARMSWSVLFPETASVSAGSPASRRWIC